MQQALGHEVKKYANDKLCSSLDFYLSRNIYYTMSRTQSPARTDTDGLLELSLSAGSLYNQGPKCQKITGFFESPLILKRLKIPLN